MQPGATQDAYNGMYAGDIGGASVIRTDEITVDATPDARGSLHAERALVLVRELGLRTETERFPRVGGGADAVTATQGYEFGERQDAWGFSVLSDATNAELGEADDGNHSKPRRRYEPDGIQSLHWGCNGNGQRDEPRSSMAAGA